MPSSGAIASQNPNKRQKIGGRVFTTHPVPRACNNQRPHHQHPHGPRRGFTHPPFSQNYHQYTGPRTPIPANSNLAGAWQQHSRPQYPISRHHSQQWHSPGLPKSTCAHDFQPTNTFSSANSSSPTNVFHPQTCVQQQLPGSMSAPTHASPDGVSQKPWKRSFNEDRGPLLSQQDARNPFQQSESAEHDRHVEPAEESWWEELRGLDYSEASNDAKYAGEITSHQCLQLADNLQQCLILQTQLRSHYLPP
jgi:hypothetical protein